MEYELQTLPAYLQAQIWPMRHDTTDGTKEDREKKWKNKKAETTSAILAYIPLINFTTGYS